MGRASARRTELNNVRLGVQYGAGSAGIRVRQAWNNGDRDRSTTQCRPERTLFEADHREWHIARHRRIVRRAAPWRIGRVSGQDPG
jgi:hypothetical protein